MSLRNVFTENLKFYRKKLGFSQQQFAEKCEISTNYLSEIERSQKFPSVEMIERIASELNIPAHLLFMNEKSLAQIDTEILKKKRDMEFSEKLLSEVSKTLKDFGFLED